VFQWSGTRWRLARQAARPGSVVVRVVKHPQCSQSIQRLVEEVGRRPAGHRLVRACREDAAHRAGSKGFRADHYRNIPFCQERRHLQDIGALLGEECGWYVGGQSRRESSGRAPRRASSSLFTYSAWRLRAWTSLVSTRSCSHPEGRRPPSAASCDDRTVRPGCTTFTTGTEKGRQHSASPSIGAGFVIVDSKSERIAGLPFATSTRERIAALQSIFLKEHFPEHRGPCRGLCFKPR
jgi:hypothetical protein